MGYGFYLEGINRSMIYLYLKTHNKTGLKYLGKTTKNPFTYKGSGKRWLRHLRVHGNDVRTEILFATEDPNDIIQKGLYYSDLWNIVNDKSFANIIPESGDGGNTSNSPKYKIGIAKRDLKHNPIFLDAIANRDMSKVSMLRKGKSLARDYNLKWYNNGSRNVYVTEGTQPDGYVPGRLMKLGRVVSESTRLKASITNGRKCVSPKGEIFHSTKAAGLAYGITDVAIRGLIKRGVSGWKYQ